MSKQILKQKEHTVKKTLRDNIGYLDYIINELKYERKLSIKEITLAEEKINNIKKMEEKLNYYPI